MMTAMAEHYGKELSKPNLAIYWDALKRHDAPRLKKAVAAAMRKSMWKVPTFGLIEECLPAYKPPEVKALPGPKMTKAEAARNRRVRDYMVRMFLDDPETIAELSKRMSEEEFMAEMERRAGG